MANLKRSTGTLQKLSEQLAKTRAKIERLQAAEETQRRKEDVRRKILVGAWLLQEIEHGRFDPTILLKGLNLYLTRNYDRLLFNLDAVDEQAAVKTERPETQTSRENPIPTPKASTGQR